VATFIPLAIGWILAGRQGAWRGGTFGLVLLASFLVHLATNLANDYFDHALGADAGDSIGGSRVIQEGRLSPAAIARALVLLYGTASLVAVWLVWSQRLWWIVPLPLFALFSSVFYVAPPVKYGYHGLGELFVGINMGPVMVVGTRWVIAGAPAWDALLVSLPVALMVASILYYQSLPDMETDRAVGKITLAVRLGKGRAFRGFVLFWVLIWQGIVLLVAARVLSWAALASFLGLPLFVRLLGIMRRTEDWVELDRHGHLVRMLYFIAGLGIVAGLLVRP
jgi:1,4-dihydroxy-2-naphthoate octaprenyltransferase